MARRPNRPLTLAARRSPLARTQAEWVGRRLQAANPGLQVEYLFEDSAGDRFAGRLADAGGKGQFTSAIEALLLSGQADIAVHSMKDLPVAAHERTPGLTVAAVPRRAPVCDHLVSRHGSARIADLPQGARVGTASTRRAAQLLRLRPDLQVGLIRGNVDTRLRKAHTDPLAEGGFDATLLAAAGLGRLGLAAGVPIPADEMLPAAGQGALAVQVRAADPFAVRCCLRLNHADSAAAAEAERQVVAALGCDCHSPVAVLCEPALQQPGDWPGFRLRARVLSLDGARCLSFDAEAKGRDLRRLVKQAIAALLAQGAGAVLAEASRAAQSPASRP